MNEMTIYLGKIISAYLFTCGVGFLVSRDFYASLLTNALKSDPLTLNLSGMVHFLAGITFVVNHFYWGSALEVVVTLLGFSFLLKGAVFLVAPRLALKPAPAASKTVLFSSLAYIVGGLWLGYVSYLG